MPTAIERECESLRKTIAELGGLILALENVSAKHGPPWLFGLAANYVANHCLYLNDNALDCKEKCLTLPDFQEAGVQP